MLILLIVKVIGKKSSQYHSTCKRKNLVDSNILIYLYGYPTNFSPLTNSFLKALMASMVKLAAATTRFGSPQFRLSAFSMWEVWAEMGGVWDVASAAKRPRRRISS